jgi:hypothetical protein
MNTFDRAKIDDIIINILSFSYLQCGNEPEPCGDLNRSVGLLYVTTARRL